MMLEARHHYAVFDDVVVPPEVLAGWRSLAGLPASAVRNLWALLGPALDDEDAPTRRELLETFCKRFEVNPVNVNAAVEACEVLLRRAAALSVPAEAFRADLEALLPGSTVGVDLLLPRYEEVRALLQTRLLERTLADHGNLLVGFDWRLDRVQVSNHGQMGDTSVLHLSLRYRHGDREDKLSLQLTPTAIEAFRALWEQFQAR